MTLSGSTSIDDARRYLRAHAHEGLRCPCCNANVKIYKREITSTMAVVLVMLYRVSQSHEDYVHVPTLITGSGLSPKLAATARADYAKLKFWGLVQAPPKGYKPKQPAYKKSSRKAWEGFWRITYAGQQFVEKKLRVQRYVYLFQNTMLPVEVLETTSIDEALGQQFDYDKIMQSSAGG